MHIKITTMLQSIYLVWEPLQTRYTGSNTNITASITQNIQNITDVALWVCYNCLKAIVERYSPNTRTTRMNPRAPYSNRMEFPSFISQLLQPIGPLQINDEPEDVLMYAPSPKNHGQPLPAAT
nr:hypothetical protein CFP56_21471 [Quercus suber]